MSISKVSIEGLSKSAALDLLVSKSFTYSEATKYYEENKPARGTGFTARFLDRLEKGALSKEDFDKLVSSESDNIYNHRNLYNKIRELANTIRANAAK